MTLAALLTDHPFADDDPLLHTLRTTTTAGEARARARALATRLGDESGVRPGEAVAARLPNGPDAVVAMFGVWMAGAVFVPVNERAPEAEHRHALDATGPVALVDADGVHRLDGAPRAYEPGSAFITWTSGTTGVPKPIVHTHDGYLELLDRVLGPLRGDGGRSPAPNLIPVSLALNAGIYNALFGLRAGAALVIMETFSTADFADLVRRFAIRSTVLPPGAIAMLNDDGTVADLGPLKYVRSITAPLSPLQARRFTERFGAFVLNGYGQAEIGEVIGWTAADAKAHRDKVGAVGRPHPGVDVKLSPDGRLLVRPPNTAVGLDPTRVDDEGYIDTGDLARIDDDGFVWIEGRASDVINRGGNKVFPEQVEEVLRLSPNVTDAAVVATPDERLGEVPVAFVVDADVPATDDELDALCRAHLVAYKVPVAYHHVDTLPRNEVGKLLRRQLALHSGRGDLD